MKFNNGKHSHVIRSGWKGIKWTFPNIVGFAMFVCYYLGVLSFGINEVIFYFIESDTYINQVAQQHGLMLAGFLIGGFVLYFWIIPSEVRIWISRHI